MVNPDTRGSLNITGPRFESPSKLDLGWQKGFDYAASEDFGKIQWALGRFREIMLGNNTFAKEWIESEIGPGIAADPTAQFNQDLFYTAYRLTSVQHTTGGLNLGKATDSWGRVKGVNGVTVCDNSVLPHPPNGNPTTSMMALCEFIADKVKTY